MRSTVQDNERAAGVSIQLGRYTTNKTIEILQSKHFSSVTSTSYVVHCLAYVAFTHHASSSHPGGRHMSRSKASRLHGSATCASASDSLIAAGGFGT